MMQTKHLLMSAGVIVTTYLAFFADKTPTDGVAEPAARVTNANAGEAKVTTTSAESKPERVPSTGRSASSSKELKTDAPILV